MGAIIRPTPALTDPQQPQPGPSNPVERFFAARLRDPRDIIFVRTTVELCIKMWAAAALVYGGWGSGWLTGGWLLGFAFVWLPWMMARYQGRFTLMLHATIHRPLFKAEHTGLNAVIPWLLGPLFGHSPNSFYVHHIGMHHVENNLAPDLSSTLAYQRDRFGAFLHYWARFFFAGTAHLLRYLVLRRRAPMVKRFVRGELAWVGTVLFLLWLAPAPTLVVFVAPWALIRFFMMAGNWAQHAFIDVADPGNSYRNSTCLTNVRYNHLCYNDGYHIVHHLKPALHYTEMARWFHERRADFGAQDAVVFRGLGNNQTVFWCLMRQDWDRLARHMLQLPGAPARNHDERVAFLKGRVRRSLGQVPGVFAFEPVRTAAPVAAK